MADIDTAPKQITCDECRELLSEYVDREIAEHIRASIERHLRECTRCVNESTRLQGLKNVLRHWDGVRGSGKFRTTVMTQMIRESQQTQIPAAQLAEATAAAAASKDARRSQSSIDDPAEPKRLPPIWLFIAALVLAAIAYFIVLRLRGV